MLQELLNIDQQQQPLKWEPKKVFKTPDYVRRAQNNWRHKHKEKFAAKSLEYYNAHKNDEEYVEKHRVYSREYMRARRAVEKEKQLMNEKK